MSRFCFTLDTEPDNLWDSIPKNSFENIRLLPDFHKDLLLAGARPTHLTTSEVIEDKEGLIGINKCLDLGNCEIGVHYHTWTRNWPFPVPDLRQGTRNPIKAMAHQLGADIEEKMLSYTIQSIQSALDITVHSHRGGRWSIGPSSGEIMKRCGIMVDSTVTPGISWSDASNALEDGPDNKRKNCHPYYLKDQTLNNSLKSDSAPPVMEIPVGTAAVPNIDRDWFNHLAVRAMVKASNLMGSPIGFMWLRPTTQSVAQMKSVLKALKSKGVPVWVFMIHSSEITPCRVIKTEDEVKAFKRRCLRIIEIAQEMGSKPATLKEAALWVKKTGFIS